MGAMAVDNPTEVLRAVGVLLDDVDLTARAMAISVREYASGRTPEAQALALKEGEALITSKLRELLGREASGAEMVTAIMFLAPKFNVAATERLKAEFFNEAFVAELKSLERTSALSGHAPAVKHLTHDFALKLFFERAKAVGEARGTPLDHGELMAMSQQLGSLDEMP